MGSDGEGELEQPLEVILGRSLDQSPHTQESSWSRDLAVEMATVPLLQQEVGGNPLAGQLPPVCLHVCLSHVLLDPNRDLCFSLVLTSTAHAVEKLTYAIDH